MAYVKEFKNFEKIYGNVEHKQMLKTNVQNKKPNKYFLIRSHQKFYPFTYQNSSILYPNDNYNSNVNQQLYLLLYFNML